MFLIPQVFGHRKSRKRSSHSGTGSLVHLTEDHYRLVKNAGFLHLVPEIVTFAGSLAYTGKNRKAAVLTCNVADKFKDKDCLTYTCASEKTDLSASGERNEKVNDLDARFKNGLCRKLFSERRRFSVDRPVVIRLDLTTVIDRSSESVKKPSGDLLAYGDLYGGTEGFTGKSAGKTFCRIRVEF